MTRRTGSSGWTLAATVTLAVAAGCSPVVSATQPVASAVGGALLSDEDAARLGEELAAQVREEEQVLEVPAVQQYVAQIGQRLLAAAPASPQPFEFTFTVLEQPDVVNAFALPGGQLFFASGLLEAVQSEAELAAVVAHEIAHVREGHIKDQLAAQVGVQTLQQLALGRNPGQLAQLAAAVSGTGFLSAFSREAESEADAQGLVMLVRAGYDPNAMPTFFDRLARMSGAGSDPVSQFVSTHPAPAERANETRALIASQGLSGGRATIVGDIAAIQRAIPGAPPNGVGGGPPR